MALFDITTCFVGRRSWTVTPLWFVDDAVLTGDYITPKDSMCHNCQTVYSVETCEVKGAAVVLAALLALTSIQVKCAFGSWCD